MKKYMYDNCVMFWMPGIVVHDLKITAGRLRTSQQPLGHDAGDPENKLVAAVGNEAQYNPRNGEDRRRKNSVLRAVLCSTPSAAASSERTGGKSDQKVKSKSTFYTYAGLKRLRALGVVPSLSVDS